MCLLILVNIDCSFFEHVILFAVFFTTWHDILSNSTFFRLLNVAYNARFTFFHILSNMFIGKLMFLLYSYPWKTWVWTVCIHLYTQILSIVNNPVLYNPWSFGSTMKPSGLSVKLCVDFGQYSLLSQVLHCSKFNCSYILRIL